MCIFGFPLLCFVVWQHFAVYLLTVLQPKIIQAPIREERLSFAPERMVEWQIRHKRYLKEEVRAKL